MNNHVVDGRARSGVTASVIVSGGLCQRDRRIEAAGRHGNNPHVVVNLDIVINVAVGVLNHTSNAALNQLVGGRVHKQDTTLIRNFRIVKLRGSIVDRRDGSGRGRQRFRNLVCTRRTRRISRKAERVGFGDNLSTHELTRQSAKRHVRALAIVKHIDKELTTTVILRRIGSPTRGHVATDETVVAGVVAKTNHSSLKQIERVILRVIADVALGSIKHGGLAANLVNLVKDRQIAGRKTDAVSNSGRNSSSHFKNSFSSNYFRGGNPAQRRICSYSVSFVVFVVGGTPADRDG